MEWKESYSKLKEAILIVLIVLDIIFLIIITFYPSNPSLTDFVYRFDLALCVILFIEFSYNLKNSDNKTAYVKSNWTDIIAFIPIDFLRAFRFIRIFKVLKILSLFKKDLKNLSDFLGKTHLNEAIGILLFTIAAGTLGFYIIEYGINNGVHNLTDSFWYSLTTTLVGGGDITPITMYGRVITGILMIVGITFVGFLTASIASWAVKNPAEEEKQHKRLESMEKSLQKLENSVEELKEILKERKN